MHRTMLGLGMCWYCCFRVEALLGLEASDSCAKGVVRTAVIIRGILVSPFGPGSVHL